MDRNERIATAFERLFRTYPQSGRGDSEAVIRERMERAVVYFEAVQPYELCDIETAVQNFITGSAPGVNPAFAPPAPQVAAEVRRVMNLRLDSERRARPLLPPPADEPITPEARARGMAILNRLKADLALKAEPEDTDRAKRSRERGEAELRWLKQRGDLVELPGLSVPVSAALMSKFEVGDPDGEADAA